jgi:type IV secretion system protein VirB10
MADSMILHPLHARDPRLDLDEKALVEASRNAFPVVANRSARRDGMGLAGGACIALLLGGATFWTLSGNRHHGERSAPVAATPVPPLPSDAAPRPVAVMPPVAAPAIPQTTTASSLPQPSLAPDGAHSPLMVYDVSAAPEAPTVGPRTAAAAPAKAGSPQPLGDTESFAQRVGDASVDVASAGRIGDPATTITQGTLIPAILETAIDSDLPGYVRALVSQDVRAFDGSHVLIPRSSRLIGQYKSGLSAGQTRAYVLWTRLIRPDGVTVALASPGVDYAGRTGLTGEVDGHFMKRFGSAMLLSVVGAAGAIGSSGTSVVLSTGGQSAASVAAQRDAQIPPTIRVRQGQPIRIFTARDLDFSTVSEDRP